MSAPFLTAASPVFHILLVEDNPEDAEVVRRALVSVKHPLEIARVETLAEATVRLAEGSIDVVLLDLSLPDAMDMQGIERLQAIAAEVPIVVLTGTDDETIGARAVQAGAQDYLVKGQTDGALLVRSMRYAVERQQLQVQRARLLEREHAARVAAEAQRERAAFLASVSARLAGALDDAGLDARLGEVAELAVPAFADCCVIARLGGATGGLVAVKHVVTSEEGPVRAICLGKASSTAAPAVDAAEVGRAAGDEAVSTAIAACPWIPELIRYLAPTSVMIARLDSHEGTEGTITLLHTAASGRAHGAEDRTMMADLARSASVAVESARLYNEARRAAGLREEFVAIASHELRTPLTTLTLQLEALKGLLVGVPEPLHERLSTQHGRMHRQSERLAQLVNDLLDVAQSRAGQPPLDLEHGDLRHVTRRVKERFADVAMSAGCSLSLHDPEPVMGLWDARRLDQLLTNLVSNALKYGKGQNVQIDVVTSDGAAVLSVRDHGIGIAPSDAERIFERFERAVSARQFSGLGLGLHIARNIAMAHGGTISLHSEVGKGATFLVRLPLQPRSKVDESQDLS